MQIKIYDNIQLLSGIGDEYLVSKEGDIIAKFFNGMLVSSLSKCVVSNDTITL